MYTPNTAYESNNRSFTATVSYYDGSYHDIDAAKVVNFTISQSLVANNAITMGTTNASKLELTLANLTTSDVAALYKGVRLRVRLSCTATGYTSDSNRTLGIFYIDEIELTENHADSNMSAKITAFDGFYKTEKPFTPPSEPSTIRSIVNSICSACGISNLSTAWSNSITVSSYPEGASCRTMIGYLAGLEGAVAVFDAGSLIPKWYGNGTNVKTITRDEQYENAVEIGKSSNQSQTEVVTIKYLESGTGDGDEHYIYPNNAVLGESISFENPLMTEERLQQIYADKISNTADVYNISFTPLSVKWRGNATIELGEIVKVKDKAGNDMNCYVMERNIFYDGGYYEEYKCCGENETTISFSTNTLMQKLTRRLSAMEEEIKNATNVISQTEGSIFELISANDPSDPDKNAGWRLYSTTNNNVILATAGGIGFSTNGGQSFDAAAIYMDSNGGHIVGTYITAGSISADQINFTSSTNGVNKAIQDNMASGAILIGNARITGTANTTLSQALSTISTAASDAQTAAGNAETAASAAQETVASWALASDTTLIDGAKIATGSITAQQIKIGWGGTNYAALGMTIDSESYLETSQPQTDDYAPTVSVKANIPSGTEAYAHSSPFYAIKGANLLATGTATTNLTSASTTRYCGMVLEYSATADGTYTALQNEYDSTSGWELSVKNLKIKYVAENDGYYRLKVYFRYLNTASPYPPKIEKITVTQSVSGEMIVNGIIKSQDGNTFFDLNTSLLSTNNINVTGGTIKIGTTNYYTKISNGSIEQYYSYNSSDSRTGGLVPIGSGNSYYEGLYYDGSNSQGVTIGYFSSSAYKRIVEIKKGAADYGGYLIARSNKYSSIINQRMFNYVSESNPGTIYESKFGVGDLFQSTETISTLNLENYADSNKVYPVDLAHKGAVAQTAIYYGATFSSSALFALTVKIRIADGAQYIRFNDLLFDSYGMCFVYAIFQNASGQSVGSPVQLATSYSYGGNTGYIWGNNNQPGRFDGYRVDIPNGATHIKLYAQGSSWGNGEWCGFPGGKIVFLKNTSIPSGSLELYDPTNDISLARLDVCDGIYGGTRVITKSNGNETCTAEFMNHGIIINGKYLRFESDGIFYDGYKLAYTN